MMMMKRQCQYWTTNTLMEAVSLRTKRIWKTIKAQIWTNNSIYHTNKDSIAIMICLSKVMFVYSEEIDDKRKNW